MSGDSVNTAEPQQKPTVDEITFAAVQVRNLASGPQYALFHSAHDPRELVALSIASFNKSRDEWSRKQINALHELQNQCYNTLLYTMVTQPTLFHLSPLVSFSLPSQQQVQNLIPLLGKIFFLDNIRGTVFHWDDTLHARTGLCGEAYHDPSVDSFLIVMDPRVCAAASDPKAAMFGTLLHECVHVFFLMWCCNIHSEDCPDSCETVNKACLGSSTGHGGVWLELASHVEAQVNVEMLQCIEAVDLGVINAMFYEFEKSGQVPQDTSVANCHDGLRETVHQSKKMMVARTNLTNLRATLDAINAAESI